MANQRVVVRKAFRWLHLWIGLLGGVFLATMGVTGGIVALRPQTATFLSPSKAESACADSVDWNLAATQIEAAAGSKMNRIYFPESGDSRVHFRMDTGQDKIFKHVIYDSCSRKVLGLISMGWMDWMVDFHHNLRAEKTGRYWAGMIGLVMLASGLSGLLLWLLEGASVGKLFRVQLAGPALKTSLDLHRVFGVLAGTLLVLAAFTAVWLCFPQTMRGMIAAVTTVSSDARAPRSDKSDAPPAGLNELIQAAQAAIPDGRLREIRLAEGAGNTQVRMWRAGDFRSLGNNVVSIDRTGKVVGVDLYQNKPMGNRIIQAMAGLHYGEWGGIVGRGLYAGAGFASALLIVTGALLWWLPRRRRAQLEAKASIPERENVPSLS